MSYWTYGSYGGIILLVWILDFGFLEHGQIGNTYPILDIDICKKLCCTEYPFHTNTVLRERRDEENGEEEEEEEEEEEGS